MDDTLYLERDYVRTGFRAVAASLEHEPAFDFLWGHFEKGTRGNTFDLLATELGLSVDVADLVETYRSHLPAIDVLPEYRPLVVELRELGIPVGLITDGHATPQRNKAEALGLPSLLTDLVLTGEWGAEYSKPHHRAYRHYAELWGIPPESLVYIGDNPEKDFVAPNELGWRSIRLRMPGGIYEGKEPASERFAPIVELKSPAELSAVLKGWM